MKCFLSAPVFTNSDDMWTDIFNRETKCRPWSELWWEKNRLPLYPSMSEWTRSWFMKSKSSIFAIFFFQSTGCRWWTGMILTWSFPNLMHPFMIKLTIYKKKVIRIENIWSNWRLQKQTGRLSEKGPMAWPGTWRRIWPLCYWTCVYHCANTINYLHVYRREFRNSYNSCENLTRPLYSLTCGTNCFVYSGFSLNNNRLSFWLGKEPISALNRHEYLQKTCHISSSCSWLHNLV